MTGIPAPVRGFSERCVYLVPQLSDRPSSLPFLGDQGFFDHVELLIRRPAGGASSHPMSVAGLRDWAAQAGVRALVEETLTTLSSPRSGYAGLPAAGTRVMGILNVTPDSFSDGGDFFGPDRALGAATQMLTAGAAIIDIGGESTRPGAADVPAEVEIGRTEPVIRALRTAQSGACLSIDSRKAAVQEAALHAGATIINDVTGLEGDPESQPLAVRTGAPVMVMHMQGTPGIMQTAPRYDVALLDIYDYLAGRVADLTAAGIPRSKICIDPGIGFGKSPDHNLQILSRLALFHGLGCWVLLGASRKSFIAKIDPDAPARSRLGGSLAAVLAAQRAGIQLVRVHDVPETCQALKVGAAIAGGTF